ncbi:polysaccharide deacetylase family protein [Marinicrinis sediminis]|uniref:Polysaccharide deacetylase family protein n=1 Tax=Marinicrinis sediminis TaxID=1652465 RepID=A0ABW5R739_9BACL
MQTLTIVMYHYVRDLPYMRYPGIKGLLTSQFRAQLDYFARYYTFVTMEACIAALNSGQDLPARALLLTFDDGYLDHYTNVFPLLHERGIQGSFFPAAKPIREKKVLQVNKIHFILESATRLEPVIRDLFDLLDQHRENYALDSNASYVRRLAVANRLDSKEVIFLKRMLQKELPVQVREPIVDELFQRYVSTDESILATELYMSMDQIRCMARNGMYIGGHGDQHCWLDALSVEEQEKEVAGTMAFLQEVGVSRSSWVMCYPYGGYNASMIELLRKHRFQMALTTQVGLSTLTPSHAYTLNRLDTVDFPMQGDAPPNRWTRQILQWR